MTAVGGGGRCLSSRGGQSRGLGSRGDSVRDSQGSKRIMDFRVHEEGDPHDPRWGMGQKPWTDSPPREERA